MALLAATVVNVLPAQSAARPFAEYWVPQSDGETVLSYFVSKQAVAAGIYKVRYRNVQRAPHQQPYVSFASARVNCPAQTIAADARQVRIDLTERQASLATMTVQNLWWLVCKGVPVRYRPEGAD